MIEDPQRLLEDAAVDPALRADLRHATKARVHGLDTVAGLVALRAAVASQAGATASAGLSGTLKLGLVTVITAGAVGLWLGTRPPEPAEPPVEPPIVAQPSALQEPETPVPPELSVAAPELAREEPPVPDEPEAESAIQEAPEPATVRRRTGHGERHEEELRQSDQEASHEATERFLREAKLVAEARRTLASDPGRTLGLTRDIAREFPEGQLVEEREALAIRALAALGRKDAAAKRAERFLTRHGHGPHADAVRRAVQ